MATPLADEHQEQPGWDYRLEEIYSGNGDGITVTVFCNTKRFVISFSPLSLLSGKDTIEGPVIGRYEAAIERDIEEEELEAQQELDDLVFTTGKESGIFERLAPPVAEKKGRVMLNEIIWPEIFYLRFSTLEGTANLIEDAEAQRNSMDLGAKMKIEIDMRLLRYSAKDIQVLEEIETPGHIIRVLVDGREIICKSGEPFNWKATKREIDCLREIEQSQRSINVPKLTGLVTSDDDGQIIAILEEYIPTDREKLSTLQDVDASVIKKERRKKWGEQIREMVNVLHEIGVVWGDGKPANVLIHQKTDDAWLIDFGGSWTDGWVDRELRETREGDEQAVKRILDFLQVD
jgi:hypothetical protein